MIPQPQSPTPKEHLQKHTDWHKALMELLDDFMIHTNYLPADTKLHTFIRWSAEQTISPTGQE